MMTSHVLADVSSTTIFTGLMAVLASHVSLAQAVFDQNTSRLKLPQPSVKGTVSVEAAISSRRSIRSFKAQPLSLEQISQLLWAAQGITDPSRNKRAAPSAGATYPLVVYIVTPKNVAKYDPDDHSLIEKAKGDIRSALAEAALGQPWVRESPLTIVFTAIRSRTSSRYGDRADRYINMEVGHAAQNVHLQAVALGLASCPVGAFDDENVSKILSLPREEQPLYIIPVGYPR